ncbi:MAG TPA: carboxypeptidase-like regulatory domain-containing protein [Flavipsychrobacter sp.]|nr:carboxypeptidase-like regulatory domain-containing protein [Flavipsychrobacter sp.]
MRPLCLLFLLLLSLTGFSATIVGDITDFETKMPMADVFIQNIRTGIAMTTDSTGKFTVSGEGDDLIEFRKLGYEIKRFRIPKGHIPSYFKIMMQKGAIELPEYELEGLYKDFVKDSIKYQELYKTALNFEKLTGLDVIRHPMSALSKRSRKIWAFQKEFEYFQKEKFVDLTFSEAIVKQLTGLQGDSLTYYMRRFRPTYEQIHNMNEYAFYNYIKQSAVFYRTGRRPDYRPSIRRNSDH